MFGYSDVTSPNYGNLTTANGSVFVCIPKFWYKWVGNVLSISETNQAGYSLPRAFINNGVEVDAFYRSKYHLGVENGFPVSKKGFPPLSTSAAREWLWCAKEHCARAEKWFNVIAAFSSKGVPDQIDGAALATKAGVRGPYHKSFSTHTPPHVGATPALTLGFLRPMSRDSGIFVASETSPARFGGTP
jgi:hypothetical protein